MDSSNTYIFAILEYDRLDNRGDYCLAVERRLHRHADVSDVQVVYDDVDK